MATNIYLGYPPENIKQWIIENHKPTTKLTDPLCFTAKEAGSTIKMRQTSDMTDEGEIITAQTIYLETSFTGDEGSWTDFIVSTDNEGTDGTIITLPNVGDKVYFRAKQDNQIIGENEKYHNRFEMTGKIAASGNLNTLLKADGSVLDLSIDSSSFNNLFMYCHALVDASELLLPATTLSYGCYNMMFYGCSSLTQAPKLPATTLAEDCYCFMFYNCTSLTKAPELPATGLDEDRSYYNNMFCCCKSPFTFPDKTFDEVANLIQNQYLIGSEGAWGYYDEYDNFIIINPVEIICSDKTMLAMFNEDEWTWTITEK